MKLRLILLTIAITIIYTNGFSQKVTFKGENVSLESVFDAIKKQTGYGFFYEQQLLSQARPVNVNVTNADLTRVLNSIFRNQSLEYRIKNGTIIVSEKQIQASKAIPASRLITGKVANSEGEALSGVAVKVKGETTGTSTDENGVYTILTSNSDILLFTHIGLQSLQVSVDEKSIIDVVLQKAIVKLDEIVVVGYGQVAQRDVTGAIAAVNSVQIQQRSPTNIYDALQGQAPGIEVNQQDGRAGAQSSVTIRGIGTLGSGAAPLYIVDGAQNVNIDGINPLDVDKIEILKDAASAAIYGARGANGVVLITTRKGTEGVPQVTGTALTTFGRIAHKIPIANAEERRLFEMKISGGTGSLPTDSLTPGRNADNDAFDFVTRTARRNDINLSLSGASKIMKYYTGIGYIGDESVIINQWAKQARFRLNLDFMPSSRFTMSNYLQFSVRNENMINERNVLHHALARIPYYVYYYPDGTFAPTISGRRNPLANALLQKNLSTSYDANLYNMIRYKMTEDLLFTIDASLGYDHNNSFSFTPRILNACTSCTNPNNSASDDTGVRTSWITQAYFNYSKIINGDHTFTAMLGSSIENKHSRITRLTGSDFLTEEVTTINSAQVTGVPVHSEYENGALSAFSRFGYNFKGKYQLNGIVRADASSRFGKDNRWGFFPSVSGAWIFSDESFMDWLKKYLSNGKLRGGYGIVGNDQSIGDYDAIQQYIFGNQFYNGVSGVSNSSTYGNNLLSWETNKQFNIGLDLGLLNERVKIAADYYLKTTTDLLYPSPLPVESGFSQVSVNLGTIQNRGFEFLISGTPYSRGHWSWSLTYNIAFNRGIIKKLANHTPIQSGAGSLTEEGQPLGNFFGWRQLRVFPYDQSNAFDLTMRPLTPVFNGTVFSGYTLDGKPYTGVIRQKQTNGLISAGGDVDWEDLDKNGIIDDADRSVLGNGQPEYTFGLNSNLTYKGITLGFNIYGSIGGQIYNAALADQTRYTDTGDTPPPAWIYGSWFKPGDITDMPKAKTGSSIGNTRAISSRYIEDGSFIRLRNVKLQYQMPLRLASHIGAEKMSFFVQGNNLMTFSNYQHFDPEISRYNPLQLGVDGEGGTPRIPRKNEVMLGFSITF